MIMLTSIFIAIAQSCFVVMLLIASYTLEAIRRLRKVIFRNITSKAIKKAVLTLTKHSVFARKVVHKLAFVTNTYSPNDAHYGEWVERSEPYTWSLLSSLPNRPKISIVVPVFNTPEQHLIRMIDSVVNQQYDNWELILVNASTTQKSFNLTDYSKEIDDRIKVISLKENLGIAGNTNVGLKAAKGEYVGLLDHDDMLAPQALFEVVATLQSDTKPGLIYSDEDKLEDDGSRRFDPHFKPDWSPHLLKQVNYLNHFTVIKSDLLKKVGYIRPGFDGAQDYDLYLRLIDLNIEVTHIPKVLYHWRAAKTSTAQNISSKSYVLSAGERALADHLKRNKQRGTVKAQKNKPGFYEINYEPIEAATVTIIIQPSQAPDQYQVLVNRLIKSIVKTKNNTEVMVGAVNTDNLILSKTIKVTKIVDISKHQFINTAVSKAKGDVLVFINAAVVPDQHMWLEKLVGLVSQLSDIGAAAPLIIDYSNGQIIDGGYVHNGDKVVPLFKGYRKGVHTYFGNSDWVRDVSMLSGRVIAIKKQVVDRLMESGVESLSDVEYKKKLLKTLHTSGLNLVIWPHVTMGFAGDLMVEQRSGSSYFNPNLSNTSYEFGLPKMINIAEEANDD